MLARFSFRYDKKISKDKQSFIERVLDKFEHGMAPRSAAETASYNT